MSARNLGIIIVVIGILVIALSLGADMIGLGAQPGILGWKQILGAAAGLIIAFAGIVVYRRK
jgi:hypothetical protein